MKRNTFTRLILILGVSLVALLIVLSLVLTYVARRPFPDPDGRVTLAGLEDEVVIYRDEYGIPHIYAENEADMFFAQGYVHAQDRFWQMEFSRRVGQGRLAEIANSEALIDTDRFIRNVGWNRAAADTLAYLEENEPESMAMLESYAAGVNAYIADNENALALTYDVLGLTNERLEVEPWEPLDTVSWTIVMAWNLTGDSASEQTRMLLEQSLGAGLTAALLPQFPDNRPVIAPTELLVNPSFDENQEEEIEPDEDDDNNDDAEAEAARPEALASVDWFAIQDTLIGTPPAASMLPGIGSNNWVVSGDLTDTGLPLLANDPHLGIQMPAIWYEIALHAPGWDLAGFSFPGTPAIVIGHNNRIAWGVTNVGPDVADLFVEKINRNNPDQYEFEGEWRDMEIIEEVIKVNGADDVIVEVRLTHHGPILNEPREGVNDVLALSWAGLEPSRNIKSIYMLNQAENFDDFRDALQYWDIAPQNFVYADVDGNIGYQTPGLIPIRSNSNGLTPQPGWTGEHEWQGWIPYEDLPTMYNPERGYIVTANNAVHDADYPYELDLYWDDGDRAQRIEDMLLAAIEEQGYVTAADFARIQFDSYSLLAEGYQPVLRGLSSDDPQVQAALERMRGWDLQSRRDSVPAALFEIFYLQLVRNTLSDELGDSADLYLNNSDPIRVLFHALADEPEAAWWDDEGTDETESQSDIVLRSVADTITWFEENVGDDMDEWTWGAIHTATFVSQPLGQSGIGLIENVVNRGPFPADGSTASPNAAGYSWDNLAAIRGSVSMRLIVDLSDFDATQMVLPTGQSGHPFHRHYDDQIELWLNGEYHIMWFSEDAVQEAAVDELRLQPAA